MDRRKLFIGAGLLVIVALLGYALYAVFFRVPEPTIPAPPSTSGTPPTPVEPLPVAPSGQPIPVSPGGLTPVTGAPTAAPTAAVLPTTANGGRTATPALTVTPAAFTRVAPDGRPQYYDVTTEQFYRVERDGTARALSEQTFPNARTIAWAPNADRAIIEFPDGANIFYDFATDRQVTLPAHWTAFSFSGRGDRIAGLTLDLDQENRFLFEADPDGGNFRPLEPLGANADKVTVSFSPNEQIIAFSRTGRAIGGLRQFILPIGRNRENFAGLTVEGFDFRPSWSPDGQHLLYSAVHDTNDYKPELWIVDGSGDRIGENRRRLHVDTWADKCVFGSNTTLFCAVPDTLQRGYGLQPELADTVPDTIERIDLVSGARHVVGRPEDATSIQQLTVSPDGATLYFVAQRDGLLHEMQLR
ncbi:MAG: hypothetical protein Q7T01_01670 [bacterium]|nr:hypothetical protein [bacterium]